VLVNNAGVAVTRPLLDYTEADWHQVLGTDLTGAWLVAQEAARQMVAHGGGGSIVNIASIIAERAVTQVPAYAAAKAGLVQLTRVMALELARYRIRVNALSPGYIETELNRDLLRSEAGARIIGRIPQRRAGTPDDLDGALLLLASDASRYMTGSVITVDGGHSIGL
jgi:NAD(P)-dependent dehydrogenase (short-subunit alcohol dehydrogenase family)